MTVARTRPTQTETSQNSFEPSLLLLLLSLLLLLLLFLLFLLLLLLFLGNLET